MQVVDADFQWEGGAPEAEVVSKGKGKAGKKAAEEAKKAKKVADKKAASIPASPVDGTTITPPSEPVEVLQLSGINLAIPRGQLCAIIGPVGSGKSSLLQALVGEMKRTRGEVSFGGSISYASQQAWIQNCTLKVKLHIFSFFSSSPPVDYLD